MILPPPVLVVLVLSRCIITISITNGSRLLCLHRSKFSSAAGQSLSARLNHRSRGWLPDRGEDGGEGRVKLRDDSYGERDSRMMWRLLAKNSVITCSTMGGSEEVVAIVM
jgi:hypothetical protein